jgi:hypothetical protein
MEIWAPLRWKYLFSKEKKSRDLLRVGEEDWAIFLLSPLFQRKKG